MNHFNLSLIKSIIRILGAIISLILIFCNNISSSIGLLATSFGLAEILGILEEIFDKRKE